MISVLYSEQNRTRGARIADDDPEVNALNSVRLHTKPIFGIIVSVNFPGNRASRISSLLLLAVLFFLALAFLSVTHVAAQSPIVTQLNQATKDLAMLQVKHDDLAAQVIGLPVRVAALEIKVDEILAWAKWIVFGLIGLVLERIAYRVGLKGEKAETVKP